MAWFEGFEGALHAAGDVELFARTGGNRAGPPLLLLHGYPADARDVAARRAAPCRRLLARHPRPARLRRLDQAGPAATPDSITRSTASARWPPTWSALMRSLGHERFAVVGHDRGGRVAHRLALDHPERVARLAVIDIVPTLDMYEATDMRFASWYYHWFFLIQPAPLPERMIGGDPAFYLRWTLGGWGANGLDYIEPEALAEYERCFCRADAIHATCEDYRASASIDLEHDRASRAAGEKIACDMLVLWGERGVVGRLFDPLAIWRAQCAGAGVRPGDAGGSLHSRRAARRDGGAAARVPALAEQSVTRLAASASRPGAVYHRATSPQERPCSSGSTGSTPTFRSATRPGRCAWSPVPSPPSPGRTWGCARGRRSSSSAWSCSACATCCRSATRSCATTR